MEFSKKDRFRGETRTRHLRIWKYFRFGLLQNTFISLAVWPNFFLTTHHWCLTCSQWVCSLWRVVRPWSWPQPAYCNNHWWVKCLMPSWCTDIYSGQGKNFKIWPKPGLTFWPHITDVWQVPSVYVACEGLSDLGHGPNQPTATIIGGYSASLQDAALIFTLVRVRISGSDQNLA